MTISIEVLADTYEELQRETKGWFRYKWFNMNEAMKITGIAYRYLNYQLTLLRRMGLIKRKHYRNGHCRTIYKCKE